MKLLVTATCFCLGGLIGLIIRGIECAVDEKERKRYFRYFYLLLFCDAFILLLASSVYKV